MCDVRRMWQRKERCSWQQLRITTSRHLQCSTITLSPPEVQQPHRTIDECRLPVWYGKVIIIRIYPARCDARLRWPRGPGHGSRGGVLSGRCYISRHRRWRKDPSPANRVRPPGPGHRPCKGTQGGLPRQLENEPHPYGDRSIRGRDRRWSQRCHQLQRWRVHVSSKGPKSAGSSPGKSPAGLLGG
ncbi:hypothetical protein K491DRAFT_782193 [Lophiostoma macrostomum CBS 122681]|uniref:Uncharacterized protein n=1 Tax=Lophiostoma macrostomum CBS 122681 TaxID=1314788 RepID=A0A6A6SWR6_9PLEO|nr:hypothetical protein K491DRAFT_782193 [Lophiostoma macrostomum CBS 122681]